MRWTFWRQARFFRAGRKRQDVRPSRVVLAPRCWRQVGGKYPADDGDNKPAHRGEHEGNRKTIACGNAGMFPGGPVVSTLVCFHHFTHETAGALGARHSPRPQGAEGFARLGRGARRGCGVMFGRHCEERSDEAIHSSITRRDGLLRFARNDDGGWGGRLAFPLTSPCTPPKTSAWRCR